MNSNYTSTFPFSFFSYFYRTICTYVSENEDEISESQRNELFEAIRFRWMSIEQLMVTH
jgi:hypothetical protein